MAIRVKTTETIILAIAIGAFSSSVPYAMAADRNNLESRTKFIIYDNNNTEAFVSTSQGDNLEDALSDCWPTKRYAVIVHGWRESCRSPWATELRENLIAHRGGCIICMDYSAYDDDYGFLLANFKAIAKLLTNKLIALEKLSFPSRLAYLFGFSFGARLITRAANDFGPKQIGTIHLCEPAGPGFDSSKTDDPRQAAISSQCIHTASGGYGTRERKCHQNWMMGNCGESQIGQRPFPFGNHGLCPIFYNYAFNHTFAAVEKSKTCRHPANERDIIKLPNGIIRMGYYQHIDNNQHDLSEVNLYAVTSRDPPFN